jgi:hypothetical protein
MARLDALEFAGDRGDRSARCEPPDDVQLTKHTGGPVRRRRVAAGDQQVRLEDPRETECLRHDADDFIRKIVQQHAPANHRRLAAEGARPKRVAQDRQMRLLSIVFQHEAAAQHRPDAERIEELAVDESGPHLLRIAGAGHRVPRVVPPGQGRQRAALLPPRRELGVEHRTTGVLYRTQGGGDEPVRVLVRQRSQQLRPDQGEDGDARGNAEPDT